jgi:hypothetical protein
MLEALDVVGDENTSIEVRLAYLIAYLYETCDYDHYIVFGISSVHILILV